MLVKIQLRNNNINRMRTTFFIFKYLKPLKLRCAFAYAFAYTSTYACASDENTNIAIIGQHSIKRRFTIQEQRIFFSYLKLIKLPDSALKAQKKLYTITNAPIVASSFVTGFIDGEGCFCVSITKNKNLKHGWLVRIFFQISVHSRDYSLLKQIQVYFLYVGLIIKKILAMRIVMKYVYLKI